MTELTEEQIDKIIGKANRLRKASVTLVTVLENHPENTDTWLRIIDGEYRSFQYQVKRIISGEPVPND